MLAMKQLFSVLVLLFSMALADTTTDFQRMLLDALKSAAYHPSRAYKISFSISDVPQNAGAVELCENYYLVNQWHCHWGFSTTPTNDISDNKLYTLEVNNSTYYYCSVRGKLPVMWAQSPSDPGSSRRDAGAKVDVSIDCDGSNTTITLNYDNCFYTDIIELNGTVLDAARIKVCDGVKVEDLNIVVQPPKISPITLAALGCGMLALFGLIAVSISPKRPKAIPDEDEAPPSED